MTDGELLKELKRGLPDYFEQTDNNNFITEILEKARKDCPLGFRHKETGISYGEEYTHWFDLDPELWKNLVKKNGKYYLIFLEEKLEYELYVDPVKGAKWFMKYFGDGPE
jgi:hypothetical protein